MHIIESSNGVNDLFSLTAQKLIKEGVEKTVKSNLGEEVKYKELRPVLIANKAPTKNVLTIPKRKTNPFAQVAEGIWTLAGRDDVEFMDYFNDKLKLYSDDGKYYRAAYGCRLIRAFDDDYGNTVDQIQNVINTLKKDWRSRRACMSIWDPGLDNTGEETKDTPCNDFLMFKVVEKQRGTHNKYPPTKHLDMTVINRSNDLIYGIFNVNIIQFTWIQQLIAACLNIGVGTYYHYSDSLHVYEKDYEKTEEFAEYRSDFDPYNRLDFNEGHDIEEFNSNVEYPLFKNQIRDACQIYLQGLNEFKSECNPITIPNIKNYFKNVGDILENFEAHEMEFLKDAFKFISYYPVLKLILSDQITIDPQTKLYGLLAIINELANHPWADWALSGIILTLRRLTDHDEFELISELLEKQIRDKESWEFIGDFYGEEIL